MMYPSDISTEESSQLLHVSEDGQDSSSVSATAPWTNRFATAEQRRRRATYDAAQQSAQELMLQQQQQENNQKQRRGAAKRIVQKGLRSARDMIQKVNIARWIDDLEHDQQVADDLDRINIEIMEEEERKKLVAHVHALCMNAIQEHLVSFRQEHPQGTYEEWIAELHPDNVITTTTTTTTTSTDDTSSHDVAKNATNTAITATSRRQVEIDPRFYVADSDHLRLWRATF